MTPRCVHGLSCLLTALVVTAAGCGRAGDEADPMTQGRPELSGLQPAVAADIQSAWEAVLAAPSDAAVSGALAMRFHAYGDLERAALWYERTRRLDPGEFRWCFYDGLVLARLGRFEAALDALEASAALEPGHLGARFHEALVRAELGQTEPAMAIMARLAAEHPSNTLVLFEFGRLRLAAGDTAGAADTLARAIYVGGDIAEVHAELARAHSMLGDEDEARRHEALYRLHRRRVLAGRNLPPPEILALDVTRPEPAEAPLTEQMLERSVAELERRAGERADDLRWQKSLIGVYGRLGRVDDAERVYSDLVARSQVDSEVHLSMGNLRLLDNRNAAAAEALGRAVELDSENARAQMQLGQALERQAYKLEARRAYARAVELAQADPVARSLLGRRMALDGDAAGAMEQYALVGGDGEPQPWALYAEAELALTSDDRAEGVELLEKAAQRAEVTGDEELAWTIRARLKAHGDQG